MSEQELKHRGRTLLAGKIACNFGQSIINCVVRRIFDHGATIEVESPLGIPEHFHLLVPDEGAPLPCKLVWRSGKELGLEFERGDAVKHDADVEPTHRRRDCRCEHVGDRRIVAIRRSGAVPGKIRRADSHGAMAADARSRARR
jgi:hypothetical protein